MMPQPNYAGSVYEHTQNKNSNNKKYFESDYIEY